MVYRFQLTNDEIIEILNLHFIPSRRTDYTLQVGVYEVNDIDVMLKFYFAMM